METLFALSNLLVLPFWLLLILAPHWRWTARIAASPWIVAPIGLLYALLIVPALPAVLPVLFSPSAQGIAAVLGTPQGATIAWAHFLAFDLFAGRWAYLESRRLGMSAWIVSPVLFLVLMVGPIGLLLFLLLRATAPQPNPAAIFAV
jgi:hypothetical protein